MGRKASGPRWARLTRLILRSVPPFWFLGCLTELNRCVMEIYRGSTIGVCPLSPCDELPKAGAGFHSMYFDSSCSAVSWKLA
jgi:hypothetical protein